MDSNILDMEEMEDTQKGKFLTFILGNEHYGLEIRYVTEIVGMQAITTIPELPSYIKGIINLRGSIIPVMDVRLRFGKTPKDYDDRTCVIVIDLQPVSIGLIVDRVSEVISIPDQEIVPPPQVNKAGNRFIKGIGKTGSEVKLLLDCEKLLSEEDTDTLNSMK
jgi:purine-binding chemotaxis protein CheW